MTTKLKIIIAIIVVIVCAALALLSALHLMNAEPLVGILGVVIGALITEFSRHRSALDDRHHQLRLAALDRRLQAHQEAFSLWSRIMNDMGDAIKLDKTVRECQEWWNNNCLYLTPEARQAFSQAYISASYYHTLGRSQDTKVLLRETEVIRKAGNIIVQGVELPPISEGEEKIIQQDFKVGA